jgi:hypothetical protein
MKERLCLICNALPLLRPVRLDIPFYNRSTDSAITAILWSPDFVNDGDDVLKAFQTYYETATLEDVTDPNLIYNMRAKLDATGYYDEPEVDRVAAAELDPNSRQSDLVRAFEPVADRLMRRFKAAK